MKKRFARRHWLKSAASLAFAASLRRAEGESRSGCPMGFGTYGLPGYSLAEAIQLVAETGFDSIEFASMPSYTGAPDQLSSVQRKEVRARLEDSGLKLGALMGLPTPSADAGKQAENTAWVERMLELAVELVPGKPPIIQSVLGGGDWDEKKSLFRDCLGPWVELASAAGVELSIKPHRGHAMSLPEQAVWLIGQVDAAETLSLVYDYSHFAFRDLDWEATVATALPYTGYLVMKDAVQTGGKVRFALPGESGEMPHAAILKKFYTGGYRDEVCCEVSSQVWKAETYDPKAATATCYSNLKSIFSEAGVTPEV